MLRESVCEGGNEEPFESTVDVGGRGGKEEAGSERTILVKGFSDRPHNCSLSGSSRPVDPPHLLRTWSIPEFQPGHGFVLDSNSCVFMAFGRITAIGGVVNGISAYVLGESYRKVLSDLFCRWIL